MRNVKDENIFDIQTPVAIAVGVRTSRRPDESCKVRYLRITGTRIEKLNRLQDTSLTDMPKEVPGKHLDGMTPRGDSQYNDWPVNRRSVSVGSLRMPTQAHMAHR